MEKVIFDAEWIKVKQTPKGYFYSERKGVDSLAILPYRKIGETIEVLTRMQPLPINNSQTNDDKDIPELFRCTITGGLEEGVSNAEQAKIEVREEAGIDVPEEAFQYLGEYYVGTQTNEKVHMYTANVDSPGTEDVGIEGDGSYFESISKNEWVNLSSLLNENYAGLNILANKLHNMFAINLL